MKEATGELNMTVVTLVAVAAIGAVFYFVVWPLVQQSIVNQTCKSTYGTDYRAERRQSAGGVQTGDSIEGGRCYAVNVEETDTGSQAQLEIWACCREAAQSGGTSGGGN